LLIAYFIDLFVPLLGEVSEWLKEHAWKVCIPETVSRVRIPLSPQNYACRPQVTTMALFDWARLKIYSILLLSLMCEGHSYGLVWQAITTGLPIALLLLRSLNGQFTGQISK
jgi:hypothetical protein